MNRRGFLASLGAAPLVPVPHAEPNPVDLVQVGKSKVETMDIDPGDCMNVFIRELDDSL